VVLLLEWEGEGGLKWGEILEILIFGGRHNFWVDIDMRIKRFADLLFPYGSILLLLVAVCVGMADLRRG
jgi:hypothetical protein